MSITWNTIFTDEKVLKDFVYNTLKVVEAGGAASRLKPSNPGGSSGITIGIGFDLKKGSKGMRLAVLNAMGLQTNLLDRNEATLSASEKIEVDYVNRLYEAVQGSSIAAVNSIMAERANNATLKTAMATEGKTYELRPIFEFKSESEVRSAYDNGAFKDYSDQVNDKVGAVAGNSKFIISQERAALIVVDWLRPALVPGLEIKAGNRAEAWFKIRYGWPEGTGDNFKFNDGWAKRHYLESELFGLYNDLDGNGVGPEEAKEVYRMFQKNRARIYDYENKFGQKFDGTNGTRNMIDVGNNDDNYKQVMNSIGLTGIETITQALDHGKSALLADLRTRYQGNAELLARLQDDQIISTNIYLNPKKDTDSTLIYQMNATEYETTPAGNNDLMIGINQKDIIFGGKGNDILLGEAGDDVLVGGEGNDVLHGGADNDILQGGAGENWLYGGTGFDTYYISGNTNHIIDEDNQGRILILNLELDTIAVGNLYKVGDANIWKDASGKITVSHNSPWKITLSDGSTIELGDTFKDGDFGIHLRDLPADTQATNTITGDLKPFDFDPDTAGIQARNNEWGNVITDPSQPDPDKQDVLYDTPGNDRIEGKGGDDWIKAERGGNEFVLIERRAA